MSLSIKKIGRRIIELHFETRKTRIIDDITNLEGYVNVDFIQNLRDIADELELHNNELKELK